MSFARCGIAAFVVLAAVSGLGAQDVRGYVRELDAKNGTITLTIFSPGKMILEVKTFNFSKADIPVGNVAGEELKLSDVPAEGLVILKLNAAADVVSVVAPLPNMRGALTAVDPERGRLVLSLLAGPETIAISPQTKIYFDAKLAALKDLTVGDLTSVTFTRDHKSVVEVRSGKGIGSYLPPLRRIGVLIDVDKDKRLARVFRSNPKGDISMLRELPLAKEATFSLCYQKQPLFALKMEEITRGFDATYWIDQVYNKVVHIDIEMPVLARRTVKALDRENRSVTILDNDVDRVLTLSPRLKVLSQGAALESLRTSGPASSSTADCIPTASKSKSFPSAAHLEKPIQLAHGRDVFSA